MVRILLPSRSIQWQSLLAIFAACILAAEAGDSIKRRPDSLKHHDDLNCKISPFLLEKINGRPSNDTIEVSVLFTHSTPADSFNAGGKFQSNLYLQNIADQGLKEIQGRLKRRISFSGTHTSGFILMVSISEIFLLDSVDLISHISPVFKVPPEAHISQPLKKAN